MTLAELGALLLEERVSRGYTVEEVASRLKITSRMVRAIEDGDVDSLPHAVYARGFVRAYAALLDLDEKAVRSALHCLSDVQEAADIQESVLETTPASCRSRRVKALLILLCCMGLAVLGYVSFYGAERMNQVPDDRPNIAVPSPEAPSVPDPVQEGTESALPGVFAPETASDNGTESPVSASASRSEPRENNEPPAKVRSESESVRAEGFAAPDADSPSSYSLRTLTLQDGTSQIDLTDAGRGKHQIILSAQQECWVHSSADGTDIRQFSLKKGEVFALSFENSLTLKLGNAGGVRIKYDGRDMPAAGNMGQVRTLVFPPKD